MVNSWSARIDASIMHRAFSLMILAMRFEPEIDMVSLNITGFPFESSVVPYRRTFACLTNLISILDSIGTVYWILSVKLRRLLFSCTRCVGSIWHMPNLSSENWSIDEYLSHSFNLILPGYEKYPPDPKDVLMITPFPIACSINDNCSLPLLLLTFTIYLMQ